MPEQRFFYIFFFPIHKSKTGSKIRLVRVATSSVKEVSQPRAWVLPKPLNTKMINPAINTSEVYIILIPVSLIV